jgi:hypothetical protein
VLSFDWRVLNLPNQESFQDMSAIKLILVWTTFASSWYSLSHPSFWIMTQVMSHDKQGLTWTAYVAAMFKRPTCGLGPWDAPSFAVAGLCHQTDSVCRKSRSAAAKLGLATKQASKCFSKWNMTGIHIQYRKLLKFTTLLQNHTTFLLNFRIQAGIFYVFSGQK